MSGTGFGLVMTIGSKLGCSPHSLRGGERVRRTKTKKEEILSSHGSLAPMLDLSRCQQDTVEPVQLTAVQSCTNAHHDTSCVGSIQHRLGKNVYICGGMLVTIISSMYANDCERLLNSGAFLSQREIAGLLISTISLSLWNGHHHASPP